MARLRVLLVDDQQLILLGLERILRRMRASWEVVPAQTGRMALELLAAEPFDVLVTDLGMPGFNGAELLAWSRARRPGMALVVLSGHQEPGALQAAAARFAHRFLAKPCDPEQLLAAVLQVAELQAVPAGALREAVAGIGQLPGSPVTCHRVKGWLNAPAIPAGALLELVLQDPGLSARVLQLVNSAFFAAARPLVAPGEALRFLNREELAHLAGEPVAPNLEALLKPIRETHLLRARRVLAITRAEGAAPAVQDLAYSAALLSAAGPMIAATLPGGAPDGLDAPELSRQYLNLVGLPAPLLDLVGSHRAPERALGPSLALAALHVVSGPPDEAFLARAGYLERAPEWRQLLFQEST